MSTEGTRRQFAVRLHVTGGLIVACFAMLFWRLWDVQVRHGADHAHATQRQSIRRIRLNPVRGRIFATDGTVLADNRAVHDLVFHVSEMRQPGTRSRTVVHLLDKALLLSQLLQRPMPLTEARVTQHLRQYPAMPLTVFSDLSGVDVAKVSEMLPPILGMEIETRIARTYPLPRVATHVLGFTGRAQPAHQDERYRYSYVSRELSGRSGLEAVYDEELAGRPGAKLVRVDIFGYIHEEFGDTQPPRNGRDLTLTLDPKAQMLADDLLRGAKGALVVLDVWTGAVRAMASSPTYDLSRLGAELYQTLRTDTDGMPLLNRAASGTYTPGSIIKVLVGLAALEAGTADPGLVVHCPGFHRVGDRPIRCWDRYGHGDLAMVGAIEQSCNTYFIHIGLATGLDRLQPMFAAAGIGSRPLIDLPGAAAGLLPSREFARRQWRRPWIAIDTAFISMGQGALTLSPLQAALFTAAIANGGTVFRPYLVQTVRDPDGHAVRHTAPVAEFRLPVSAASLDIVRNGMYAVVNGDRATAVSARNPAISVAGKTGTAEVGAGAHASKDTWFIAYAPAEAPVYALVCVIEGGDSGGRTAAPLAGRFFREWLGTTTP